MVSGDGSWQRHGFTSLNGFVSIISMNNGMVIDVEPMSKHCKKCVSIEKFKKSDPVKYESMKANHDCPINYKGSAPNMEVEGMKRIFNRSITNRSLRYTELLGDGDSKTLPAIENTYAPKIKVIKKECAGHIQKRVGNRLRKLKKM